MKRKHIRLNGDPQKRGPAGDNQPPTPGQPRRLPGEPLIAPSARARIEVLRDRRNHAYAPTGKTVSRHSGAAAGSEVVMRDPLATRVLRRLRSESLLVELGLPPDSFKVSFLN